jgi:hypothetical protein
MAAGRRLLVGLAVAVLTVAGLGTPGLVVASPNTIADAQAELDRYEEELQGIEQEYEQVRTRLETAQRDVETTATAIAARTLDVDALRTRVTQIALQEWQSRGLHSTAAILVSEDTQAVLQRLATTQRLAQTTDDLLQRYQLEQAELADQRDRAAALALQVEADSDRLADLKSQAEAKVKTAEAALIRFQAVDARAAAIRSQQAAAVNLAGFPTTDRAVGADTGLRLHVIQVRQIVAALYPAITTVGGYRAGDWGEHGKGLALDIMIPGWGSAEGDALGADLAAWFQVNSGVLGVDYIIWQQRFWQVGSSSGTWQLMGDRGSPTQNHMDHVHVSFKAGV